MAAIGNEESLDERFSPVTKNCGGWPPALAPGTKRMADCDGRWYTKRRSLEAKGGRTAFARNRSSLGYCARPKGMHRKTYERLVQEQVRFKMRFYAAVI
jgi:hypothetical protein